MRKFGFIFLPKLPCHPSPLQKKKQQKNKKQQTKSNNKLIHNSIRNSFSFFYAFPLSFLSLLSLAISPYRHLLSLVIVVSSLIRSFFFLFFFYHFISCFNFLSLSISLYLYLPLSISLSISLCLSLSLPLYLSLSLSLSLSFSILSLLRSPSLSPPISLCTYLRARPSALFPCPPTLSPSLIIPLLLCLPLSLFFLSLSAPTPHISEV